MPRFPDILAGSRSKSGHSCLAEKADIDGPRRDRLLRGARCGSSTTVSGP